MAEPITAVELAELLGLNPPTAEQAAVIEAPLGPVVVIAGAGSGKTETMSARVVWLVANRLVAPGEVLGLTFTRKAADQLATRIRRRLAGWRRVVEFQRPDDRDVLAELMAGEPTVLTYAAYAGRVLAEHALRIGAEPSPRVLSQAARWQLADSVVRRFTGSLPADIGALSSVPRYLLQLADKLADHLTTPDAVEAFCDRLLDSWEPLPLGPGLRSPEPEPTDKLVRSTRHRRELMAVVRDFETAKRGTVDFGDQMALAARLAANEAVAAIERDRFRAVLLDEYQDTGHAQIETLRALFGAGHAVTAVGDPFQSIYGWRGASAGNIGRFATTFRTATGRVGAVYPLATSWRNDEVILDAANAISAPLRRLHAETIELRARPGAAAGRLLVARLETHEGEADWVAQRLAETWERLPAGDRTAAVLVRRRSQIPLLADALVAVGLPVDVVGLGGLLMSPEVVDVIAMLRVLADHRPATSLMRMLTGARWRIGARDLSALYQRARALTRRFGAAESPDEFDDVNLVEALDDLGEPGAFSAVGYTRLVTLAGELRVLRRRLNAPLPDLVAEVERLIGVDVEAAARPERGGRVQLDRLLDEAARFAAESDEASLGAFLAFIDAAEQEDNGLELGEISVERERVQILTVHGAKGLEWDVVALPGLVKDVFPALSKSNDWTRSREELPTPLRGDAADLPRFTLDGASTRREVRDRLKQHADEIGERHQAEERRLAYVAVTRARSTLFASGYLWDTSRRPRLASVFLEELAAVGAVDGWVPDPPADAANPLDAAPRSLEWPIDPLGAARPAIEAGAELVRAALEQAYGSTAAPPLVPTAAPSRSGGRRGRSRVPAGGDVLPGLLGDVDERREFWRRDVDLLLAERARLADRGSVEVELPAQLSVSQLVTLRRDPDELARRLRRPLPGRPAPLARRGTAFHLWLEQRWSAQTLLDVDELPGAADETADDADVVALREAFERSEWAARTPAEVEVPFEMDVDGVIIRGRMDAVFGGPDGWMVVDWKTGARPHGADATASAVQLAAYRLAWARLTGIPDDRMELIRAAFHYVRTGETVAPSDLLDAAGLRRLVAAEPAASDTVGA